MKPVTLVLESSEALLLLVALREYFQGDSRINGTERLRSHPTSKAILDGVVARLEAAHGKEAQP